MLARTTLDTGLLQAAGKDPAEYVVVQRSLLALLMKYAFVLMGGDSDLADLVQAAKASPGEVRKLWLEALASKRLSINTTVPKREALSAIVDDASLARHWHGIIEVAITTPMRAAALSLPEGQASTVGEHSRIEIVRHDLAPHADPFARLARVADEDIPLGTTRDELWTRMFAPVLAAVRQRVVVLDRYAGHELVREQSMTATRASVQPCGANWFLSTIARTNGNPLKVEVIVAETEDYDSGTIVNAFERLWPQLSGGRINEMTVIVASRGRGGDAGHPRHVRFDHRVFVLDKGISLFAQERTSAPVPWKYQIGASGATSRESTMTAFAARTWQSIAS